MKIKRILRISLLVLGVTFVGTSCTSTEKGVLVGGALGAAAGGAISDDATGAVIGGLLGAAAGAAI